MAKQSKIAEGPDIPNLKKPQADRMTKTFLMTQLVQAIKNVELSDMSKWATLVEWSESSKLFN